MITYAIRNKRTNKYVYGTDYRYHPKRRRLSENKAKLFESLEEVKLVFDSEMYNPKFFEIVKLSCKCIGVIKDDNY